MGLQVKYSILLLPLLLAVASAWSWPLFSGELQLEKPIRPARVYASAPSGLHVTSVRVASDNYYTNYEIRNVTTNATYIQHHTPRYYIHQFGSIDHQYFYIDEYAGNITTNRYIDRLEGEEYRVLLLALIAGRSITQEMTIVVTKFNKHPPRLSLDQYTLEVIVTAARGTTLLTVEAFDEDEEEYNRHLQYFLADPQVQNTFDFFMETPTWSPLDIDPHTGELIVRYPLDMSKSPLRLLVGASDWGSPQRHAIANLTIYIREMSEPRNVTVSNTTESSLNICWYAPSHGAPEGYVLTYTPTVLHRNYEQRAINLTLDQLNVLVEKEALNITHWYGYGPSYWPIGWYGGYQRGLYNQSYPQRYGPSYWPTSYQGGMYNLTNRQRYNQTFTSGVSYDGYQRSNTSIPSQRPRVPTYRYGPGYRYSNRSSPSYRYNPNYRSSPTHRYNPSYRYNPNYRHNPNYRYNRNYRYNTNYRYSSGHTSRGYHREADNFTEPLEPDEVYTSIDYTGSIQRSTSNFTRITGFGPAYKSTQRGYPINLSTNFTGPQGVGTGHQVVSPTYTPTLTNREYERRVPATSTNFTHPQMLGPSYTPTEFDRNTNDYNNYNNYTYRQTIGQGYTPTGYDSRGYQQPGYNPRAYAPKNYDPRNYPRGTFNRTHPQGLASGETRSLENMGFRSGARNKTHPQSLKPDLTPPTYDWSKKRPYQRGYQMGTYNLTHSQRFGQTYRPTYKTSQRGFLNLTHANGFRIMPILSYWDYQSNAFNLSLDELNGKLEKGALNLTLDQVNITAQLLQTHNHSLSGKGMVAEGVIEMHRYCASVGGLAKWTEYVVGVRAWRAEQISLPATPGIASTTNNFCANGTCGRGNCSLHIEAPGYTCYCHPGYYGQNCQYSNPCFPENPCLHFGRCVNISHGTFRCECPPGFYGPNCTLVDPCSAIAISPCFNGGSCVSQESSEYKCLCPRGFFGDTCEGYDPCSVTPCYYGAWCTNLTNTDFICHCSHGYSGKLCNIEIDECSSSPCKRGLCVDRVNDFTCNCPEGWGGKTCEVDLDECASSPCLNGATCIDALASYICDCAYGYKGQNCGIPESCPAQTTILDTGEFQWPATRHGEVVTLACPYGTRITAAARSRMEEVSATEVPKSRMEEMSTTEPHIEEESATELPKSRMEEASTTELPKPHMEEFATELPRPRMEEVSTTELPKPHIEEVSTTELPKPRMEEVSTTELPKSRMEEVSTTELPKSRMEEKFPIELPKFRIEESATELPKFLMGEMFVPELPRSHIKVEVPTKLPKSHFDEESTTELLLTTETPSTRSPFRFTSTSTTTSRSRTTPDYEDEGTWVPARMPPTIMPPIIGGYTTHAEWKGGMIHINRRTRNAPLPSKDKVVDASINPGTDEEEDRNVARRRFISSRIRGTLARNNRRYHRRRQPVRAGRGRGGTEFQQTHTEEQSGNQQSNIEGRTSRPDTRHFGLQNQPQSNSNPVQQTRIGERPGQHEHIRERPIAQPRIGIVFRQNPKSEPNRFENKDKTIESPRIGQVSESPNIQEGSFDLPVVDNSNLETPRIAKINGNRPQTVETRFNSRIGETKLRSLGVEDRDSDLPRTQVSPSQLPNLQTRQSNNSSKTTNGDKQISSNRGTGKSVSWDSPDMLFNKKNPDKPIQDTMAVRACVLLRNGTVTWKMPDIQICRGRATHAAEHAAKELASLTSSPLTIDAEMFTDAAQKLARIVEHALDDSAVASNMISAFSNLMEVNDSVLTTGDEHGNTTYQLVSTINTFTGNIPLRVGEKIEYRSDNLVVETRMLKFSNDAVTFRPYMNFDYDTDIDTSDSRRKRETNSSAPNPPIEPYLKLPPEALSMAETENVRLEFVSYRNDKFFRGGRSVGMPVISAKVTNSSINNLSKPIVYYIPTTASPDIFKTSCVFWDDQARDWSSVGVVTLVTEGIVTCETTHLTAFSVLLDPLPAHLGVHEEALSIITYVGLALSTAGLAITVATYTIFRTLNRDRSGKIVMNLSLALLLLNLVFIATTQIQPPSVVCTIFAAALHYLVLCAFAWMLVEGANMYQLLITVFASSETHFMAKRVVAAWGTPILVVIIALVADIKAYGDEERNFCVINPTHNPAVYYSTYMGPICCVLAVNCVVFVMVTRVLCQRRPRSKARSPSGTPPKESIVTLAQVRGAVTVVALLGVTWVAGAFSVGWARLPMQYIFCLTTPLQGLIIFIVRVAQHPEARAAWITLLTTGTLRRRPPTTHTHSTHSSGHTHSTTSSAQTPPRNNHSSIRTRSTHASPATSVKTQPSIQTNGSVKHQNFDRDTVKKNPPDPEENVESNGVEPSMSSIFSRIVKRISLSSPEPCPQDFLEEKNINAMEKTEDIAIDVNSAVMPHLDYPLHSIKQESFVSKKFSQETFYHSNGNGNLHRPQSLVLLQTDSHGNMSAAPPSTLAEKYFASQIPALFSGNVHPQTLLDAGVPASMIPRRSLGSLLLLTDGKEGDDSSWHFVRPPPDGRSDPLIEREVDFEEHDSSSSTDKAKRVDSDPQTLSSNEMSSSSGCIVLAGQRIVTDNSPVIFSGQHKGSFITPALTRASSELQMGSPQINPGVLRRSSSVFTLGEWEDPRSSLA